MRDTIETVRSVEQHTRDRRRRGRRRSAGRVVVDSAKDSRILGEPRPGLIGSRQTRRSFSLNSTGSSRPSNGARDRVGARNRACAPTALDRRAQSRMRTGRARSPRAIAPAHWARRIGEWRARRSRTARRFRTYPSSPTRNCKLSRSDRWPT